MLTTDQLSAIDRHLRKDNWLLNEDLIAELTDHYADAIADQSGCGVSFDTALNDVHKSFGGRKGLLKMEEDFVAQAYRAPMLAYFKNLKTFLYWPKAFVPIGLLVMLYAINERTELLETTIYVVYGLMFTRLVFMLGAFIRLVAFGKASNSKLVKKHFRYFPGSLYLTYLLFNSSLWTDSNLLKCLLIWLWMVDFICALDLLFTDKDFSKQLRFTN